MQSRKPKALEEPALFEYAVRSLASRGQSLGQVRDKLRRRAAHPGDIEGVLARLKDLGYLNDQRFAESFASGRLQNQGLGKLRVLRELRQRRVAPALAEKVVGETYLESDETALIGAWLERKYRGKDLSQWLKEPKNLASAFRRMRLAGFSPSASIQELKRHAALAAGIEALAEEDTGESPVE